MFSMIQKKKRIALFIDYVESEYAQRLIEGAGDYLSKNDGELIVFTAGTLNTPASDHNYQRLAVASLITPQNIDGIIFITGPQILNVSYDYLESYLKSFAPIPVVSVGCKLGDFPYVSSDCRESMTELIEHLIIKHNRKNIALLTGNVNSRDIIERTQIYKEVLEKHNLSWKDKIINCEELVYGPAINHLEKYFEKNTKIKFDAIVCLNDEIATACIHFFSQKGIKIPEKVLITGFDDETRDSIIYPALTSINQNIFNQGYEAAKIILETINGTKKHTHKIIKSHVAYRQSCGCLPENYKIGTYMDSNGKIHNSKLKDIGTFETSRWFNNRNSFVAISHMYSNLQLNKTLPQFSKIANDYLKGFGLKRACVILFETPKETDKFEYFIMPKNAYVYCAFDTERNVETYCKKRKISFNPNEQLMPKELNERLHMAHTVTLFSGSKIFGYILYEPGVFDSAVYEIAFKMLSAAIINSYNLTLAKEEAITAKLISVTDELTGLMNRRGLLQFGKEEIEKCIKAKKDGLILFGDIDGLKKINDTFGHDAGDRAIKAEAELLKSVFCHKEIVGRLGGDEFAVIAPKMTQAKYKSVRQELDKLCDFYNNTSKECFTLSISIGCAEFNAKNSDINNILSHADEELYKEKQKKHSK